MSFGELVLDDRRFQDLVSQARREIHERCPEWTEHNVSDPGIALIETFAWMTDMLSYRLNRVPDKLHLALLSLLDVELEPPRAATTDLLFRLTGPAERAVRIPMADAEVATPATGTDEPVVFAILDDFVIEPVRPQELILQRAAKLTRVPVVRGTAESSGHGWQAFSPEPLVGDALYLGFARPLDRLVVRVDVEGAAAEGPGVDPRDPPLQWEVSHGPQWHDAAVLTDTTGGFNLPKGAIELQLPEASAPTEFAGHTLHWLRCRVTEHGRGGLPSPRYAKSPRIRSITAHAVGALLPAEHAASQMEELLGVSDGTSGQTFRLRFAPALDLREGETLEVHDPAEDEWVPWSLVESFEDSRDDDCHFRFDPGPGEVELGPAIRLPDGTWQQYGAVPDKDVRLRMTRYRHGGGERGNVEANTLQQLRNPIPGVASVTNPRKARGGSDAESIDEGRERAALELRTRYRAVTAEDFAHLATQSPAGVARAHCIEPAPGDAVPVYVLPFVDHPARPLRLEELTPSDKQLQEVADHLDRLRLVGTTLTVQPMALRGVTVVTDVLLTGGAAEEEVEDEIRFRLYRFVNPIVGGEPEREGDGWDCGRTLTQAELIALVEDVPGVDRVKMLRIYEADLAQSKRPPQKEAGSRLDIGANEVVCSVFHHVRATHHHGHGH